MIEQTIDGLASSLNGRLIRRADPRYDEVRRLYNGMIDKRPLAIAQCADVADVVAAVDWARQHGLRVAVRGGGHNGPGLGSVDDGLVIDLAGLNQIEVDAAQRTVRVGGGCTTGQVDAATHPYGLAVPFGIMSTTGVGGLTLGGGMGHLARAYGLTIDNLLEAEVVLADGRVVTASSTSHADLFWALRGGGGNFGVVVSFIYRAHPVRDIFGGPVFYDVAHARTVMQAYRDFLPEAPERLGIFVGLKTVPMVDPFPAEHQGKTAAALIACFNGPEDDGRATMAPLLDQLPEPLFDWRSVMPFPALQALFDPLLPKGLQWYWRGDFVRELPDAAIEAHLERARTLRPGDLSLMHLYPIDGAVHRVEPDETAWRARDVTWAMVIAGVHPDSREADRMTRWAQDYWAAVHPWSADGGYVNFMMGDASPDRLRATYGENYDRLAVVKGVYDPTNFFAINNNIPPA
jgi:FAD/FMN-containing dehydrogenase